MIDITTEKLIPIRKAPAYMPGRPHLATVWRFATRGVRGVKLETIVSGGRRFTSVAAIEAFVAASTAAAMGSGQGTEPGPAGSQCKVATPRQREASIRAAERALGD